MVVFSAIAALGIGSILASAALSFGLNLLAQALRPRPDTEAIDAGQMVQTQLSLDNPVLVLVGQRIVGGAEIDRFSYGTNNEFLVSVSVLSVKPCDGFVNCYIAGEVVALSGDPTLGEVEATAAKYRGKNNEARLWVRVFLGDQAASVGTYLNGLSTGRYAATDLGGESCIAVWRAQHTNDDIDENDGDVSIPWQGPPDLSWEMKGARLYDPRVTDATWEDDTTHIYSENPVIIDFNIDLGFVDGEVGTDGRKVVVGNGYPEELLDVAHVEAAADWIDAKGWTCSGVIRSANPGDQEEVWKSMNAVRLERPAQIVTMPQGFRPSWGELDLTGEPGHIVQSFNQYGESTEVFNEMHGSYVEPDEVYGQKILPIFTKAAWVAADNHIPRVGQLDFRFVTDGPQARQLLKEAVLISRAPARLSLSNLHMHRTEIPLGERITITGCKIAEADNIEWVVEGVGTDTKGVVSLVLREWPGADAFVSDVTDPDLLPTNPTAPPRDAFVATPGVPDSIVDSVDGIETVITPSSTGNSGADGATVSVGPYTATWGTGAGTVTYAWSFVSGGTGLTITAPTSQSTSVEGTADVDNTIFFEIQCVITNDGTTSRTRTATGFIFGYTV